MFKLTKILNSGVNVAQPERFKASAQLNCAIGTLAVLKNGEVANAQATEKPELVIAQSKAGSDGTVLCERIFPDMIFECPISAQAYSLKVGDAVTLDVKDGASVGVTATTASGVVTVVDLNGAKNAGDTIFVRIV